MNSFLFICDFILCFVIFFFFFFNDTATTEIYTLSLHDALPISWTSSWVSSPSWSANPPCSCRRDRKSTRLNSSHTVISYAVFCLKKKKNQEASNGPVKKKKEMTTQHKRTE